MSLLAASVFVSVCFVCSSAFGHNPQHFVAQAGAIAGQCSKCAQNNGSVAAVNVSWRSDSSAALSVAFSHWKLCSCLITSKNDRRLHFVSDVLFGILIKFSEVSVSFLSYLELQSMCTNWFKTEMW